MKLELCEADVRFMSDSVPCCVVQVPSVRDDHFLWSILGSGILQIGVVGVTWALGSVDSYLQ